MMEMILSSRIKCIHCSIRIHGSWMATWDFNLDVPMQRQMEEDKVRLDSDLECIALPYHSLVNARPQVVVPKLMPKSVAKTI